MKEKFAEFWKEPKHRVLVMVLVVLLAYLSVDGLLSEPGTEVASTAKSSTASVGDRDGQKSVVESKNKADKMTAQVKEVSANDNAAQKRNPFAIPAGYREVTPKAMDNRAEGTVVSSNSVVNAPNAAPMNKEQPIAKGIIGSSGQGIAILSYGNERKQCMVGELIGPYKVMSIYTQWVTLEGPEGTISLKVGQ